MAEELFGTPDEIIPAKRGRKPNPRYEELLTGFMERKEVELPVKLKKGEKASTLYNALNTKRSELNLPITVSARKNDKGEIVQVVMKKK